MKQYLYQNAPQQKKENVQSMYIESRYFEQEGVLPTKLFEYTNIEILGIRGTLKKIPKEILKLSKLKELNIAFMSGDALPECIGELQFLEKIHIAVGHETVVLPQSLAKLKNLKAITLQECKLTAFPLVLTKIPQLEVLELSANQLSESLNNECYWAKLKTLNLNNNNYTKIPDWVYQHRNLENLFFYNNKLNKLDDRIVELAQLGNLQIANNQLKELTKKILELPKLKLFNWFNNPLGWLAPLLFELDENIFDFRSFSMQKHKDQVKTILSIRKALVKASLKNDASIVNTICLLLNEAKQLKDQNNRAILDCYAVNNQKIRDAVVATIKNRLKPFEEKGFTKNSELLILGKTIKKKTELETRLKELEIKVAKKKTAETTHVLLGKNIKNLSPLEDNNLVLLTENQLNHFLDNNAPTYLVEETAEKTLNTANIKELLISLLEENITVALALLKGGGVPKELMTSLFVVHKFSADSKIVRQTKKLLELNASPALLELLKKRFLLKKGSQGYFTLLKYIDEICANTELTKIEITNYGHRWSKATYPYSSLHAKAITEQPKEEQEAYANAYWLEKMKGNKIALKSGDQVLLNYLFKMNKVEEIESYPASFMSSREPIGSLQSLKKLTVAHEPRKLYLSPDFGSLANLNHLVLVNFADFAEQTWEELKKLKSLRTIEYIITKTSLKLSVPPELCALTQVEKLVLEGPYLNLNIPIEQLKNLKNLEVNNSSLENIGTFFEQLEVLPKLKNIKFHAALDDLYQQFLNEK